jgi:asparagine synthetase B (glutamine-hydrolysing)
MRFFHRFRTKQSFEDGSVLATLHRYALRLQKDGFFYDIGFENANCTKIDYFIHVDEIVKTNTQSVFLPLSEVEKANVIEKTLIYCDDRKYKYQIVRKNT